MRAYPSLLNVIETNATVTLSPFKAYHDEDLVAFMKQDLKYLDYPVAEIYVESSFHLKGGTTPHIFFNPLQKEISKDRLIRFMPEMANDDEFGPEREQFMNEILQGVSTNNINWAIERKAKRKADPDFPSRNNMDWQIDNNKYFCRR